MEKIYNSRGFDQYGIHKNGTRFDDDGYDMYEFDKDGYDMSGFNLHGWNKEGKRYNGSIYDENGFDVTGTHENGKKYDNDGYDVDGFNSRGINRRHFYKDGTYQYNRNKKYDSAGLDMEGYDKFGWDSEGYDRFGIDCRGYYKNGVRAEDSYGKRHASGKWRNGLNYKTGKMLDIDGYDRNGYGRDGYDRDGYDRDGYDRDGYHRCGGYNRDGLNRNGLTREQQKEQDILDQEKKMEQKKEIANQQRKNYLGLKNKAEKLAKGEMSLVDYIKCSKTSIDDLIDFAKKEHMEAEVIRGLHKHKKLYAAYKKTFKKEEYLKSNILIIDGQEVRPSEEDVDKCMDYLKAEGALICDKTVKDTVRGYLRGEIDITIKEDALEERIEENNAIISENEQKIADELVGTIIEQQDKIKSQQIEIGNIRKKEKGTYGE